MLLAQIRADYSSVDDISSEEETQEDDSESEGDKEAKKGNKGNGANEDGKSVFSCTVPHKYRNLPVLVEILDVYSWGMLCQFGFWKRVK